MNVCEKERQVDSVRQELPACLKDEHVEPPLWDCLRRITGSALRQAEQTQTPQITGHISVAQRISGLTWRNTFKIIARILRER